MDIWIDNFFVLLEWIEGNEGNENKYLSIKYLKDENKCSSLLINRKWKKGRKFFIKRKEWNWRNKLAK